MILRVSQGFSEALEMYDLARSQETDRVADVGVFHHPQDVIVGAAGLLLRRQILKQIRDRVAL